MNTHSKLVRQTGGVLALAFGAIVTSFAADQTAQREWFVYDQHNLVSDDALAADHGDGNLRNAWGIAFNPFAVAWVANNHSGTSTLYDGTGKAVNLVVDIPSPSDSGGGSPTGVVFNASNAFVVTAGTASGPSRFIFATEEGVIAGWSPTADGTHAVMVVDNSSSNAIYKGLALSAGGSGQLLYATDFHNAKIDVFNSTFAAVTLAAGAFTDSKLPHGFAPFGIQAVGGNIYVTYALQDADAEDEQHGPGQGFVDVYDPNGILIRRVVSRGDLNAPWGVALAPAGFGAFSNALLIGNFGDGRINAFDPISGAALGPLRNSTHHPIEIDGLWGIAFGNGFASQPVNTLFFAAGPRDESAGLYGRIDVHTAP
jgi:uncharacterized protein (TIGR03118 family)